MLCALLALGGVARADEHCAPVAGGGEALVPIDARLRLAFIRERLRDQVRQTRIWAGTWGSLYGASTVIQLSRALATSDRDVRIDAGVAAGASFVGVAVIGLMPQKVLLDQPRLERRLRQARPDEDVCALVADAERFLVRDAGSQRFGRSPLVHAGNFVFNFGLGMLLILGFDHVAAGMLTSGIGILVGEIQTATQPSGLIRDLERYRRGELGPSRPRPTVGIVPTVSPDRYGLQLRVTF